MNAASPNTLGRALRSFFADHLPCVRGTSPHTVSSYRDTFILLLRFGVLAIPFKPTGSRAVEYLEFAEIQAVFATMGRHWTVSRLRARPARGRRRCGADRVR